MQTSTYHWFCKIFDIPAIEQESDADFQYRLLLRVLTYRKDEKEIPLETMKKIELFLATGIDYKHVEQKHIELFK